MRPAVGTVVELGIVDRPAVAEVGFPVHTDGLLVGKLHEAMTGDVIP